MRVLVAFGSKMGGTEGIARTIGDELRVNGVEVEVKAASEIRDLAGYDAAIIGGALYANLWRHDAWRLVMQNLAALRRIPVWLFSSGPLDTSADHAEIAPVRQVAALRDRVGALGHRTFGGRLAADAKGFPASAMAKTNSGDWRNDDVIRAWAAKIAGDLPHAKPGAPAEPQGGSLVRLIAYGVAGWALCAALMATLLQVLSTGWAVGLHAAAAPLIFAALSVGYFNARGAREPLAAAVVFTALVVVLDAAVVAGLVLRDFSMFASFWGTWLPFLLIFAATWATGRIMLMMPAQ